MFCDWVSQIAGRREEHQRHQRHHEGRHLEAGDEEAVDEPDQRADGEHDQRPPTATAIGCAAEQSAALVEQRAPERAAAEQSSVGAGRHHDRAGDADEAHDRALAEVDADDDDDEGLADRDGKQRPDVGELVGDVARRRRGRERRPPAPGNRRWSDRGRSIRRRAAGAGTPTRGRRDRRSASVAAPSARSCSAGAPSSRRHDSRSPTDDVTPAMRKGGEKRPRPLACERSTSWRRGPCSPRSSRPSRRSSPATARSPGRA